MKIWIDGENVPPDQVTFSELGFGTPNIDRPSSYELRIPARDFIEQFGDVYDECIEDLKLDDAVTGDVSPSYSTESGYPSLRELIVIGGTQFHDFIYSFLKFDIFEVFFRDVDPKGARFTLGTTDEIVVDDEYVRIRGRARAIGRGICN